MWCPGALTNFLGPGHTPQHTERTVTAAQAVHGIGDWQSHPGVLCSVKLFAYRKEVIIISTLVFNLDPQGYHLDSLCTHRRSKAMHGLELVNKDLPAGPPSANCGRCSFCLALNLAGCLQRFSDGTLPGLRSTCSIRSLLDSLDSLDSLGKKLG